jgi:hypothetical protein
MTALLVGLGGVCGVMARYGIGRTCGFALGCKLA